MEGRDRTKQTGSEVSHSRMTTESAPKSAASESGWKLESVRFRPAVNGGVIATCERRRERPDSKRNELGGTQYKSDDYAFEDLDSAVDFLRSELSGSTDAGSTTSDGAEAAPSAY